MTQKPHAAVREAIQSFRALGGFRLKPPLPSEKSIIFDWGVRLEYVSANGQTLVSWMCLADESCRNSENQENLFLLSGDKTSKATKHLREAHGVVSSKTISERAQKRMRDDEVEQLTSSTLYATNPERFTILMETLRIINHNLPFRIGEYKASKLIDRMMKKPRMQGTVSAKLVRQSIVELYASTKAEIKRLLQTLQLRSCPSLTMMTDLWSCKLTHTKYIGLRVFAVDSNFELKSVLLGTRKFKPAFGDRDIGISGPLKAYLEGILEDFGLRFSNFFAASTDGGSDVKRLVTSDLNLNWEWCTAHMAHAATKAACGMDTSRSQNPEFSELLAKLNLTIFQLKSVEKAGDLFEVLCHTKTEGKATQLVDFTPARFLSVTKAFERVIEKWEALQEWYEARILQAERHRTAPPSFPLAGRFNDMVQVLSLLQPLAKVKRMCQAATANQVDVLLALYNVRLHTLKEGARLKDFRSKPRENCVFEAADLTPLAVKTRALLRKCLDDRFFCRYTNPSATSRCSFLPEMQQRLHPEFKQPDRSLNMVVRLCCKDAGFTTSDAVKTVQTINFAIDSKVRDLMLATVETQDEATIATVEEEKEVDELRAMFGIPRARRKKTVNRTVKQVDDELRDWQDDTRELAVEDGTRESVLDFWRRMSRTGEYKTLPTLARILFAMPASSAHIERDFSVCGEMVSSQRAALSSTNVDMCTFLNRNKEYVDMLQCTAIPPSEIKDHLPPAITYTMEHIPDEFFDGLDTVVDVFSTTSLDETETTHLGDDLH